MIINIKNITLLFLLSISEYLFSQTADTTYKKFYFQNTDIVQSEGYMVDGKPDGYWKSYFQNGRLRSEGNRKNFELDGLWKFYDEDGKTVQLINYLKGKKNGAKTTFNPTFFTVENYVDDIKEGMSYTYDYDSLLLESVNFSGGLENGLKKYYDKDGNIIKITKYKSGYIVESQWINKRDNKGRKQGRWVKFHDNDHIAEETLYLNDRLNGYKKIYDEESKLVSVEKYRDGMVENTDKTLISTDIRRDYHPNGKIKTEASYRNNLANGIRREFDTNGIIVMSYIFNNGNIVGEGIIDEQLRRHGSWKEYYVNGTKKSEGRYNNGLHVGHWYFYDSEGRLQQEGEFDKGGKYDGSWIFYYPSGNILKEESYLNGTENGMYIEYSEDGDIIVQGTYTMGMKEGKWTISVNGVNEEGSYVDGKKDGRWRMFYNDETMMRQVDFVAGNPNGRYFAYYTEGVGKGNIFLTGNYINGYRDGDWTYFDREGNIELTIRYNMGEEMNIGNE